MKIALGIGLSAAVLALGICSTSAGEPPRLAVPKGALREFVEPPAIRKASPEDKAMFAEIKKGLLAAARKKPLVIAESNESGFFVMAHRMLPLMDAYAWSRDPAFVDALVPIIENLLAQRYVHPAQPDVWSGWWHYKNDTLKLMPMHTSIMYWRPVLKLAAAVRADPKLEAKYSEKVERWYKDVTEVSIPAWDKRGTWHDLGRRGGWYTHTTHYPDRQTGKIVRRTDLYRGSSLAYNKVHTVIEAFVLLHRMTGDRWYRERIEKCERFFRSHWRAKSDHVDWNYRDFSGPWDFKDGKAGATKTGYFIHPKGGYYASDIEAVVACYDVGLVFAEADIKALLKTNLEFMWMDDDRDPKFRKINGSYTAEGKYGKGYLWTALARFSPKVRRLWKAQLERDRRRFWWASSALQYLIAKSRPVSMQRLHVDETARGR